MLNDEDTMNLASEPASDSTAESMADPGSIEPEPGDYSAGSGENQEQVAESSSAAPPSRQLTVDESIVERLAAVNEVMTFKEGLTSQYIKGKCPKPFYSNWKAESNSLFALLVNLSLRRRAIARRQAASKVTSP